MSSTQGNHKIILQMLVILLFIMNVQTQNSSKFMQWDQYCIKFQRQCSDVVRKQNYQNRINYFLSKEDPSKFGVNNFTDYSDQELKNLKKGNKIIPELSKVSSSRFSLKTSAPSEFDWRTEGVVTQVKDQGQCGSCWAFASAAAAQSKLIIDKRSDINIDLSEQYLLSCTPQSNCDGGYMYEVMPKALRLPQQSEYPYQPFQPDQWNSKICQAEGIVIAQAYANEYNLDDQKIIQLLVNYGPLAIGIGTDFSWYYYGSGIYQCIFPQFNHAVLLVGYTSDYWVIKNQWGTTWGQDGYMKITRQRNFLDSNCLIGASVHYFYDGSKTIYDDPQDLNPSQQQQQANVNESELNIIMGPILALIVYIIMIAL